MNIGKYMYCIIGAEDTRNFGPIGIGGRGDIVSSLPYRNLSCIISDSPMEKYVISRENLTAHEKVIEDVMKDYTVLPFRFCTIAASAQEIRELLRKRYVEFKNLLRDMDNKIELGVKAIWKDMDTIFKEISQEDEEIRRIKERSKDGSNLSQREKILIGEKVKKLLDKKREEESEEIFNFLKRNCVSSRSNKIFGDNMILNAAFLVDRGREKEFDNKIDNLVEKYKGRIEFKYVGPVPPFNFVEIVVQWGELCKS